MRADPVDRLTQLWQQQIQYNTRVRLKEQPDNYEYWMKQYLLGIVAEIDEVLQEINWKIHRRGHPVNRNNLARELADITKFVWCLWEWSGFTANDMLTFVEEKSNELNAQWQQDFEQPIPEGASVIITDLDGTIGDWRKAFYTWLINNHDLDLPDDTGETMLMEITLGMAYSEYIKHKEEFEASGGYLNLPVYEDAKEALEIVADPGKVIVIAYTARPARAHGRIWSDTWNWIADNKLPITELRIGAEERIVRGCTLRDAGHQVLMLEDDPSLALRAANAGLNVFMRAQPYNEGVEHSRIARLEKFDAYDMQLLTRRLE